ncbi:glycine, alanine and asparagine-rich protein-like [Gossypium australe]|uniref:Glycine, alanine and asparagine-rich protein-like n=1 Tax=Gossypium australe TaxID=47621 RepID=A0A5B6VNW7_9ROSI|nr:glycine, alanine and asparagine-rich protein-like [Gossypium australe]
MRKNIPAMIIIDRDNRQERQKRPFSVMQHMIAKTQSRPRGVRNEWLASKSVIHPAIASPFMAEAHASLQVIKLGITLVFQFLTVLGDSKEMQYNMKRQVSFGGDYERHSTT